MTVQMGDRQVGESAPCFVIAEAGINHNGDVELAHLLVEAAAKSRADAVKFQLYTPEHLALPDARKAAYQTDRGLPNESQLEMLRRFALTQEQHLELREHAHQLGLVHLVSVFDEEALEIATGWGIEAIKLPSGELTNFDLLEAANAAGVPLIVSTGMASLDDVSAAMAILGKAEVVLMHCVSSYPARADDANLRAMDTLRAAFGVPVGFSDHTMGVAIPIAAAALGAAALEKHLTLDASQPDPDHSSSMEPEEFAKMVAAIHEATASLGSGAKAPTASERDVSLAARKSLIAARDIKQGQVLSSEDLVARRPGTGIPPSKKRELVGRTAARPIPKGSILSEEMIS